MWSKLRFFPMDSSSILLPLAIYSFSPPRWKTSLKTCPLTGPNLFCCFPNIINSVLTKVPGRWKVAAFSFLFKLWKDAMDAQKPAKIIASWYEEDKKSSLKLSPVSSFFAETTSFHIRSAASLNWPPQKILYFFCTSVGIYLLQRIQHGRLKHENCEGEYHYIYGDGTLWPKESFSTTFI